MQKISIIEYHAAIIGCWADATTVCKSLQTYPGTEIVAIAEWRRVVGEHFKVRLLYPEDIESLVREVVPNIAVIVTPTKYHDCVF